MSLLLDGTSSSSTTFQFNTIGKPKLLKRISAPEPDQDYQDDSDSTPCPSPAPKHDQATTSSELPLLLQRLSNDENLETNTVSHTIGNPHSDLNPGTSTAALKAPPTRALNPVFAPLVQTSCIPAMRYRPRSSSDMETSSSGTIPHTEQILAPTDGAVGIIPVNTRFTSADPLNELELAYPATERRFSTSQEPFDSYRRLSKDIDNDNAADQGFFTRLNNLIAHLESKSLQQSKVLATIASLERDFQLVTTQTSLALDKANQAEAVAEQSFSIAKGAVAVAQQSVAAVNIANIGVENALATLVHLRQCYADEHAADEHDRADLLCKMISLKRDIQSSSSHESSCITDVEPQRPRSADMSAEAMKSAPSAKKRKFMDSDSTCDLTSHPSKEARHEHSPLLFDRNVESEAEAVRKAWVQEADRLSAVPPDLAQRAEHTEKENDATTSERNDSVVGSHGHTACSGPSQSQLVNENGIMSSDKLDTPLVGFSEQNDARGRSHSEESSEKRAQWEREVVEHKLEIARFQMQERDLQEKEVRRKKVEEAATTVSEQKAQSASLSSRLPPTSVPATITAASMRGRHGQQTSQPKPGLSDASRLEEVKTRLAFEKQRILPAIGRESSSAPSTAQIPSPQTVIRGKQLQEAAADTEWPDFQGQGQTGNSGFTGALQEQGEKERDSDDKVTGANPRGRGTPTGRGSIEAKDTSRLSVGNVTVQKTATSQQEISTSANALQPLSSHCGSFSLQVQLQDQDARQASLPPITYISEPDQVKSNGTIKSSRSLQKRRQGTKKATKPQQNAGNIRGMNAQPSSTGLHEKDAASNVPAVPLASSDVLPKVENISPVLPSIDWRTPPQVAQNLPSSINVQPVTASPRQNEYSNSSMSTSVPQPSGDSHRVLPITESRSKSPSKTAEHGPRTKITNALQPRPDEVVALDRVSNLPSKITSTNLGQTGNTSTFLKTPHGGHREISGTSSKPPSRSGLVDYGVLSTNGQQTHGYREEVSTGLNSKPAIAMDLSRDAPAANTHMLAERSSMPGNPPANVSISLNSSQTLSSNDRFSDASIRDNNPLRQATDRVVTSQQPTYSKSALTENRHIRSRSRSPHSFSPPLIANRKRSWKGMEGDHWSPGTETRGRRLRPAPQMLPRPMRSRSPNQRVPLSQRLSESANPQVGRYSYRSSGDSYLHDESPYCVCEDNIDRPRDQSRSLLNRFTDSRGSEFVPSKRPRFRASRSTSREGRGIARPLQERIS